MESDALFAVFADERKATAPIPQQHTAVSRAQRFGSAAKTAVYEQVCSFVYIYFRY